MEGLGDFLDSLTQSLSQEQDCAVGDEFCALVVGIGHLRDAMKESEKDGETKEAAKEEKAEDKGESEAGKEKKTEHVDIGAIAWTVENNLTQFIG